MSSQFNSNSSASFGIGISNYNTSNNNVNNFLSGSSGCFSSAGSAAFNQFAAAGGCGGGPNFGPTPSGSGPTPNTTNIILQTLKRRANKNFVPLDERVRGVDQLFIIKFWNSLSRKTIKYKPPNVVLFLVISR